MCTRTGSTAGRWRTATKRVIDFEVDEYFRSIAPFTRQDTLDVECMPQPVATVAAHTAPMAIHFYTGDQFPPEYHHQAFVALRAGVRGNDLGHKVMAVFSDPDGQMPR